jgi:hypothetical protein
MKVKELIEQLSQLNPEYSVELSKVMSLDIKSKEAFEIFLDFPIIGLAENDEVKEVRLVVQQDKSLAAFGSKIFKL